MNLNIGNLIWMSAKPILKLAIIAGGGMALSRAGILTASASKNLSKIIVNLLMPCLLFANMSASLSSDNLKQLGVMLAASVFYVLLGLGAGTLMKRFLCPPARFKNGIIAASGWSNWGDLPLAIILSVGDMAPFQQGDSMLGLAFVSALICVFNVTLFPMGGHRIVEKDFKRPFCHSSIERNNDVSDLPNEQPMAEVAPMTTCRNSIPNEYSIMEPKSMPNADLTIEVENSVEMNHGINRSAGTNTTNIDSGITKLRLWAFSYFSLNSVKHFLINLLSPTNLGVFLGLIVAFTPPIRQLFVRSSDANASEPPLYFLLDTASFIGAGSVPLSITNLGAALAKMKLKSVHPLSASGLAIFKLIITPIIAIFVLDPLLVHGLHWVDPASDRALRFVYMLAGCMPTATTCLLLTQLYSPDGQAREVAGALVIQYVAGILTMVGALCLIIGRI
ncbi:auxin efflux carrier [Syncephalis fuscata]|nr:auxin efflux carrier [Syncephalis fuscata]